MHDTDVAWIEPAVPEHSTTRLDIIDIAVGHAGCLDSDLPALPGRQCSTVLVEGFDDDSGADRFDVVGRVGGREGDDTHFVAAVAAAEFVRKSR